MEEVMLLCQHCKKECKNGNSLRNHERLCKENPNKQDSSFKKFKMENPEPWNKGKTGIQAAWNKGKEGTFTGKKHSDETKRKMSENIKQRYADGWECTAGRCKKYYYSSPIAGDIKVDGSWELIFCKYADAMKLKWRRNTKRFPYTKPDGKLSTYLPDFFVEDWDSYIEVKGYETDLDNAKWEQFPKELSLKVLRRKEIGELDEWLKSAPC